MLEPKNKKGTDLGVHFGYWESQVKVQGPNLYPILGRENYCDKNHMWLLVNSWAKESNLWFKVTKGLHALKANCTQGQS